MSQELKTPHWVYDNSRPSSDSEYFSNLTRCIFQAGLSWKMIDNKWKNFEKAFDNFKPEKIYKYGPKQKEKLMMNEGIVRNKKKIDSTIENAKEFVKIFNEFGGFQSWLDQLDKTDNYKKVAKELQTRFNHVGPTTANIFIWSIGEPIKHDSDYHKKYSITRS